MTIDRLGEGTILVTLLRDDMARYGLDFDAPTDGIQRGLIRLMGRVGEECGLDHRGKSYLIEALPGRESCLLIISVRVGKRRRWRIRRRGSGIYCRFDTADDLLEWLSRAELMSGYALYAMDSRYYLLPDRAWSGAERAVLNEYGVVAEGSAVSAARIREYGTLITLCPRRIQLRRRHVSGRAVAVGNTAPRDTLCG